MLNSPSGNLEWRPSVSYSVSTGGAVSQAFTYTPGGRIATSTQTTDGVGYPFTYAYYMDGSVASVQYPSGRTVSYPDADRVGRLTKVTGTLGGVSKSYVSAMTYNEQGLMAATALGNGLTERWSYNAQRQQPYDVRLGTAENQMSHLTLQFAYCANNYAGDSCATNNGNILGQFNYANNHIEHYGYDAVNRLSSATDYVAAPNGWSQSYSYDRYGNRWVSANGALPMDPRTPTPSSYINPANNRLTGANYAYDAVGNQTTYGGWTLSYDAENRLVSSQSSGGSQTTYAYDGEGRRVKKTTGATSTWFVYNASGELAAEYEAAPPSGAAATHFVTTDHLGSTRLVTDASGNVVSRHDYLPFGEEIPSGYGGRTTAMKYVSNAALTQRFTGKERDTETGLDYFGARYLSGVLGRWTSPDEWAGGIVDPFTGGQVGTPGPLPYADITDTQTINKYSYVRNNPLRYTDPDGHVIDTLADIGFIVHDIYEIATDGATTTNVLALGADIAGAFIPFATGGGTAVRVARAAERGAESARLAREGLAFGREIAGIEGRIARQMKHLDAEHIGAAARELKGEIVKINPRDGRPFDHVTEVREAAQGLQNQTNKIKSMLGSGGLTKKARATLENNLQQANKKLEELKKAGVL